MKIPILMYHMISSGACAGNASMAEGDIIISVMLIALLLRTVLLT
jgi:hypothetical protein